MKIATTQDLGFSLPAHRLPYESMSLEAGIGSIGLHWVVQCMYLPAYRAARYNLTGAAENNPDRIREAVSHGYPAGKITNDWKELVTDPDIAVIDCCFGHRHDGLERRLQVIQDCATAGKSLMIQKPVAHNLAIASQMARIAAEGGIHLAVNQNCRYNPANTAIKNLLTGECLGKPQVIEVRQYWGDNARMHGPDTRHATIDHTIHHVDLIRWWVASPCISVFARSRSGTTLAIYEFENGTVAYHIENHSGIRSHENEIRVMTERGTLRAGHNWGWHLASAEAHDFVHLYPGEGKEGMALPLPTHTCEPPWHGVSPWEKDKEKPYYDIAAPVAGMMGTMGLLLHAAATGATPDNNIASAIESLRIALAAQHSARTGRPVDPRSIPDDFTAEV